MLTRAIFADPSRIRAKAKAEANTLAGNLRAFFGEALDDKRSFEEQTIGGLLLTFYRRRVHERGRLKDRVGDLEDEEKKYLATLDEMLDDPIAPAPGLIARIEAETLATKTGDRTLDRWYDALDSGEVPTELWGPKGPPEGWIKGAQGWKAPPGWKPPRLRKVGL